MKKASGSGVNEFVKVEVATLVGPALDWAVAKCEGHTLEIHDDDRTAGLGVKISVVTTRSKSPFGGKNYGYFAPSVDCAQGDHIIDRDKIATLWDTPREEWWAGNIYDPEFIENMGPGQFGATRLIAAMRCRVANTFGVEIEIPAELISVAIPEIQQDDFLTTGPR